MNKFKVVAAAALLSVTGAVQGSAQDYPGGPLRYVLHVEPGGATDVMGRRLAEQLQKQLGENVIVENRPGGSGARQMAQLARAKPDGLTLGSVTASHLGMFQQSGQFNIESVEWACNLVLEPYLLTVRADSGIESMQDLVAKAKASPGSLSVAGFGEASGGHIAWLMFGESAQLADGDINWVPYNSVGDAVVATLGGHNNIAISYIGLVKQHVDAGTLKVIGIMSDTRSEIMPDVPTFAEAGFDVDTRWQQFRGIIMPKGTPPEAQQALCAEVETALQTPELQKYITDSALIPGYMPTEEFTDFAKAQETATKTWLDRLGHGQ
ncbi:Bug family tripartite tricarboxylate transporter substrate binding protein [Cereibacter changlensis]|nr:tripartite tricarboxylate transporter substrate binding protein [Cereibacter changlensis]